MKPNDFNIFFLFHPKSGKFLRALYDIGLILTGAFFTLCLCYAMGILAVSPEQVTAVLVLLFLLVVTITVGGNEYVKHANMSFNKSYISGNFFFILKRHPYQLGYDYIDVLLPKLEEICGNMTVRAIYAYETSKNPADETPPLSTDYRDAWTNNPSRKIIEILFESAENSSTDRHLKLSYKRASNPLIMYYSRSYVEGDGFNQDDRERIINVIENEEWRLKPKYGFIANIRLGFTYLIFVLVSPIILFFYWDNSYGHIAWFIVNMIILCTLILILCLKCLIFPAGAFCIDHEVEEIKERERTQRKIIRYIERFFGWLLYILGIRFIF